ncbi:ATP-binding protein [Metaplanococcus flavidus]|uniref:ATP-binding protein n=1 Tax=Metaplanococcus flavidus TaxID=569883 RepID=A0ABW3LGR4_9BACL
MMNALQIGDIVEVKGTRVKVQVEREMNHSSLIHEGELINNVTVNAFIIIKKGIVDIVGKIDAEYIEDLVNRKVNIEKDQRFRKNSISRVLEIQIVGFFSNNRFSNGVRHLPMIGNIAYIPRQNEIINIFSGLRSDFQHLEQTISIGKSIYEELPVSLPLNTIFASHIGIFGNTGSGKSNTLAKLYTELYKKIEGTNGLESSRFHLIDFNGEYAHKGIFGFPDGKTKILQLSTSENTDGDKIRISTKYFFNEEILSILFSATPQTQKPFIKRILQGIKREEEKGYHLKHWLPSLYIKAITSSNREALEYILEIIERFFTEEESQVFFDIVKNLDWNSKFSKWMCEGVFIKSIDAVRVGEQSQSSGYKEMKRMVLSSAFFQNNWFEQLIYRARLQLASDLINKFAQYEHISPLIHRIESKTRELEKVFEIISPGEEIEESLLTIYSFRDVNLDVKKILPTIVTKMIFDKHKENTNQEKIDKTIHLIIDEAHNILSSQSKREGTEWHDYRLDLFEEIIKEGRKYGVFLTISSQRPSDISPTIISQIHNYFIHRLVNYRDLELIDNTISSLDRVSKNAIPTLASGMCIITGTALVMPIFIAVDQVAEEERPNSGDIVLTDLWGM